VFLPRPEADRKIALDFLDLTYGLCSRRIAPHALNQLAHAFRDQEKFSRAFPHAECKCSDPVFAFDASNKLRLLQARSQATDRAP